MHDTINPDLFTMSTSANIDVEGAFSKNGRFLCSPKKIVICVLDTSFSFITDNVKGWGRKGFSYSIQVLFFSDSPLAFEIAARATSSLRKFRAISLAFSTFLSSFPSSNF